MLNLRCSQNDLPRLGPDPRLPRALLRDLSAEFPEGEGRVAYYLPSDDANAVAYTQKRYDGEETVEGEVRCRLIPLPSLSRRGVRLCELTQSTTIAPQTFDFRWVRDYELASSRPLTQEFIVAFDAGADATEGEQRARPRTTQGRGKGAYYAPLQSTMQLRKRRPRVRPVRAVLVWPLLACDTSSMMASDQLTHVRFDHAEGRRPARLPGADGGKVLGRHQSYREPRLLLDL